MPAWLCSRSHRIYRRLKMKCDRCNSAIEEGYEREHLGQVLCEDCYMDILSPAKSCDPWAVYSAKSFDQHTGRSTTLTPTQTEIIRILKQTGGIEREALLERLKGKLTLAQLEREFATLRHMEKARAEKREGKVFLRVW
jgi:late competence protein required for DNA uptake (superfamily II DNA/RNA helicase)